MSLDFIAEMAWKSLVICAAALGVLALLRSRSAADRATMLRLSVVLLLALPVLAVVLPALNVEEPIAPTALQPMLAPAPATAANPTLPIPAEVLVQSAYLAGLLLVTARLLVGLWTLRHWTRMATPITAPAWRAALVRAGGARVRLLASDLAPSPMSWGLRRPVILIDRTSLVRPEDADAILAHEMAHVTRKDWPALMLSRLAVALFWFNPLVWLLDRCLVQHAEEAADLQAVVRVEPVGYARTLLECVRSTGLVAPPANSMAPGHGLARRLGAVLDPRQRGLPSGSLWTTTAMAACIAVAAPVAALELIPAAPKPLAAAASLAPPSSAPRQAEATAHAISRFASALEARAVSRARGAPSDQGVAPQVGVELVRTSRTPRVGMTGSLLETRNAQWEAWSRQVEVRDAEWEATRAQWEATNAQWQERNRQARADRDRFETAPSAYEEGLERAAQATAEATMQVARADAMRRAAQANAQAALAAWKANEAALDAAEKATEAARKALQPEFTKVSASALTLEQAVQLRALGVDTDQVEALAALGYRDLTTKQLVAMDMFKVTPAFISELASLGYRGLSPEQLIELRVHRVSPDYIRDWAARGYTALTTDQMVQMRIRPDPGTTIQEQITIRVLGGPDTAIRRTIAIGPSPEELVRMRLGRSL